MHVHVCVLSNFIIIISFPFLCCTVLVLAGRGVFIALCIVLERYTVEGMIDLFQTVKTLRIQRSAMVQTRVRRKEGIGRERG